MIIQCPNCGEKVAVNGLGRKPLNIPLKNVYEALWAHSSVEEAANELRCSQGYIYNILKANGLNLKDVFDGQVKDGADLKGRIAISKGTR